MELHLDISGRMSGDMFIAAVLDAFPDFEDAAIEAIDAVSEAYPVDCRLQYVRDHHIHGRRFIIEPYTEYFGHLGDDPNEARESWGALRQRLQSAQLPAGVRRHAMGILMQPTRKQVAGLDISLDAVTFVKHHAWQLMTEAVGAAALIDGLGNAMWTARTASRDFASPIGEGILIHLGVHPHYSQAPAVARAHSSNLSGAILRSGVGLADPAQATGQGEVRLNCFEELSAGAVAPTEIDNPAAGDQNGSRS
jgi:uncharacterized protein (DUF111 family)